MSQVTIVHFVINIFLYEAKNVLVDFKRPHNYKQQCKVELQMAGQSWFVGLERTFTNKVLQVSFKYGWGAFCADNNLNVGDIYFFSVIHEATYSNDDVKEWEEELEDDEAKLKVEVHKTIGRWKP
ncbi:B3 domain-containing protein_Os02g10420-like [Miscanthus floridulus]|uniref:B3 domain-containing protein_Os02g10420-like n=1 Tax=Miscanthus floridulus TaxID=154761 RepID=UPI00345A5145